jgi:cobalt/nickel transport system ATP-binding protein
MSQALLRLSDVAFRYADGRKVLRAVSFEVAPGDALALTGANGSGKSTLLRLLVGLLTPQSGTLEILGRIRRSEKDFRTVRGPLGLLFQSPDDQLVCPTVLEDVQFGPLNLGRSPAEAARLAHEALEEVGLPGYEGRITTHLSLGEKRLVSLAGVLALSPRVLLLDEPTAGLDDEAVERLRSVLDRLDQARIIAGHDRAFLKATCRRRLHLADGALRAADLTD